MRFRLAAKPLGVRLKREINEMLHMRQRNNNSK